MLITPKTTLDSFIASNTPKRSFSSLQCNRQPKQLPISAVLPAPQVALSFRCNGTNSLNSLFPYLQCYQHHKQLIAISAVLPTTQANPSYHHLHSHPIQLLSITTILQTTWAATYHPCIVTNTPSSFFPSLECYK